MTDEQTIISEAVENLELWNRRVEQAEEELDAAGDPTDSAENETLDRAIAWERYCREQQQTARQQLDLYTA